MLKRRLLSLCLFLILLLPNASQASAATEALCRPQYTLGPPIKITYNLQGAPQGNYVIKGFGWNGITQSSFDVPGQAQSTNPRAVTAEFTRDSWIKVWLELDGQRVCPGETGETLIDIKQTPTCGSGTFEVVGIDPASGAEINDYTFQTPRLRLKYNGASTSDFGSASANSTYFITLRTNRDGNAQRVSGGGPIIGINDKMTIGGNLAGTIDFDNPKLGTHSIGVGVYRNSFGGNDYEGNLASCMIDFHVSKDGDNTVPIGELFDYELCAQIPNSGSGAAQRTKCESCELNQGIWTAVGCIKADATSIVKTFIQIGLGMAGGIALLMIIAAGFLFSTSQNDPKKVTEARDLVTSAVIGLLFILFSVTILQFIGVTILRIPGFGG